MPKPARADAGALPSVQANLTFNADLTEPSYLYAYEPPPGATATNMVSDVQSVPVHSARSIADQLSLDVEGIAVVRHRSAVRDFWDEPQTLALGHPEAAQLVKDITGASRVVVFDHTLRRVTGPASPSSNGPRSAAVRIHVDQTVASGPQRVRDIMGDQAEALLKRRAAIINVWRPIAHEARDWPLAAADASSIDPNDLIPTALVFPNRRGEIYNLRHNPAQRWLYIPDLRPDEAILIKCWDSDTSVAQFTPHAGFEDPSTPPGTPPRESIEFRTIAFFD